MAVHMILRKYCIFPVRNSIAILPNYYSTKSKQPLISNDKSIESVKKSIAAKGFLRSYKSYTPPEDAANTVKTICSTLSIPTQADHKLINLDEKFNLLRACFKEFNHNVPNSQVHELQTVGDVMTFYECAVDTTVPYEAFKKLDLPRNLHIQYDYIRFNPETDTMFDGQTAFPKSSTLVTGLKYRGKYKGFEAKRSWP